MLGSFIDTNRLLEFNSVDLNIVCCLLCNLGLWHFVRIWNSCTIKIQEDIKLL